MEKKPGCYPGVLTCGNHDMMIKLWYQKEFEKRCNKKVQSIYLTPLFSIATKNKTCPNEINQQSLKNILHKTQRKVLLFNSIIRTIRSFSQWISSLIPITAITHLVIMKIVVIYFVFSHSIYQNNSSYIPLLLALYIYSTRVEIDIIRLLNYFCFL